MFISTICCHLKESVLNTTAFVLGLALSDARAYRLEAVKDAPVESYHLLGYKYHVNCQVLLVIQLFLIHIFVSTYLLDV